MAIHHLDTVCKQYFADFLDRALEKLPALTNSYVFRIDSPIEESDLVISWFKKNTNKIVSIPYFLSTSIDNYENTKMI